jgi:hypothetical protein
VPPGCRTAWLRRNQPRHHTHTHTRARARRRARPCLRCAPRWTTGCWRCSARPRCWSWWTSPQVRASTADAACLAVCVRVCVGVGVGVGVGVCGAHLSERRRRRRRSQSCAQAHTSACACTRCAPSRAWCVLLLPWCRHVLCAQHAPGARRYPRILLHRRARHGRRRRHQQGRGAVPVCSQVCRRVHVCAGVCLRCVRVCAAHPACEHVCGLQPANGTPHARTTTPCILPRCAHAPDRRQGLRCRERVRLPAAWATYSHETRMVLVGCVAAARQRPALACAAARTCCWWRVRVRCAMPRVRARHGTPRAGHGTCRHPAQRPCTSPHRPPPPPTHTHTRTRTRARTHMQVVGGCAQRSCCLAVCQSRHHTHPTL